MSKSERRGVPSAGIGAIVGGALLAIGSFLPWAEVSGSGASVTAKGLDGSDGFITLAAGLVAVVTGLVMLRATRRAVAVVAVVAGLIGGVLGVYDAVTAKDSVLDAAAEELAPTFGVSVDEVRAALDQAIDAGQLGVSISIGLYVVMAGGLVAIAGGVLGLREPAGEGAESMPAADTAPPSPPAPIVPPAAPDAAGAPTPPTPPDPGTG